MLNIFRKSPIQKRHMVIDERDAAAMHPAKAYNPFTRLCSIAKTLAIQTLAAQLRPLVAERRSQLTTTALTIITTTKNSHEKQPRYDRFVNGAAIRSQISDLKQHPP